MLDRKTPPPIKQGIDFKPHLEPYQHFHLLNQTPVYTLPSASIRVCQIEWLFFAGSAFEKKNGVGQATAHLLKNGTAQHSAFELSKQMDYYGAFLQTSCGAEVATITLNCLSKHLPFLLPLVAQIIEHPIFPQEEINTYIQNQKQALSVNLQKCEFVANRLIDASVYGATHPYGKYLIASDYEALTQADLVAHHHQHYVQGKCIILAAGNTPHLLKDWLNVHFGAIPLQHIPTTALPRPTPATSKKQQVQNYAEGVQTAIRMARPFPNRRDPDFKKVHILNTLFGGFFGSRLMKNIREEKGYTYGIHSFLENHIQCSAWVISTEVGKEVASAAIDEIHAEMKKLRTEPISDEELRLVKNYTIGSILGSIDGSYLIMARWKMYILNGLSSQYFTNTLQTIQQITSEELMELSNKYLNPDQFYEVQVT